MSRLRRRQSRPHDRTTSRRRATVLSGLLGLMMACGVTAAVPAHAQSPAGQGSEPPVLLGADQVTFDEEQGLVTARGNVELSQGQRTMRADAVSYNRKTGVVTASGNIRIVEPSGDIVFADYAELTDDMRDAFVDNVRVLMTDNARMAAAEGERRGERMVRLNRGVYSPCDLCPSDPTRPPVWQVRAVRIVHDREEREIRFKDATLEMFGVPVAYTPYLSQPDPTVERKSGFLTPLLGSKSGLGIFIRPRYYVDIAPDQDATLELGAFSNKLPLLGGEYRKRFERGRLELGGSVTKSEPPSLDGRKDEMLRGHVRAKGLFEIDEVWRTGFDAARASDETYLRRYHDYREYVLTSRAFAEGFRGRSYAAVNAYSWQDLRYGNVVEEPIVAPLAVYDAVGEPGSLLGGRWSLNSGIMSLYRSRGASTRRVHVQPGWRRDVVSGLGFVTTFDARLLAAGYDATHYARPDQPAAGRGETGHTRLFPQGQMTVRYPFVRYGEQTQQLVEPIVALTAAPSIRNDPALPNEDSQDIEFDHANLFRLSRFPGIDRLEGGTRFTYGLRSAIQGSGGGAGSLFLGQSYRLYGDATFPAGSGLEERRSDYVGRLDLSPGPWLNMNYAFRLDQETLTPRRHSLTASAGVPAFRVTTNYTYIDQIVDPWIVSRRELEQANIDIRSRFTTHWSVGVGYSYAFRPEPGPRTTFGTLMYEDECFTFQAIAQRSHTNALGERVGENAIYFQFVFKNLGEFRTPGIGDLLGG